MGIYLLLSILMYTPTDQNSCPVKRTYHFVESTWQAKLTMGVTALKTECWKYPTVQIASEGRETVNKPG